MANSLIIVIIHWWIKPTAQSEVEFLDFWVNKAKIKDKSKLTGEFLSQPLPAADFDYRVNDFSAEDTDENVRHFMNVGIWESAEAFHEEVGHNFNDSDPIENFEAKRRTRTILKPREYRIGCHPLPKSGSCE